ncbi:signal peptidase I [Entomospira entomophila]|uniref:Signal peptidase I n=1 Tax=Entomospira entomophila TaxID=2719988 RepID=A0A968GAA2_9SPIO|nr:signal peptidase I [Entomospira entomophilus]NIZ40807.1 signal peptidase I [Entomospira entomophilus]WDI35019.1 signal peptidase I [Entomospira entomophilus]
MAKKGSFRKRSYQQSQAIVQTSIKYFFMVFGLIILLYFIRFALFSTYVIPNDAMLPTYVRGDMVLASSLGLSDIYDAIPITHTLKRGDIVLVESPGVDKQPWWAWIVNPVIRFMSGNFVWIKSKKEERGVPSLIVKRVVALPGDTIRMQGHELFVKTVDGEFFVSEFEASDAVYEVTIPIRHEAWLQNTPFSGDVSSYTLGEDEYFVLGDNRTYINDSRTFGVVSRYQIHAVVLFRYFKRKPA